MATEATDDRRGDIRAALAELTSKQEVEPVEGVPEVETPEPEVEAKAEPEETAAEKKQRAREEDGKFAKEPKQKAAPKIEIKPGPKKTPLPGDAPQNGHAKDVVQTEIAEPKPVTKAPASWKIGAREEWAKLPPAVHDEVQRREREVAQVLSQTAQERQSAAKWQEVTGPYEMLFRQENANAHQAVGSLLRTAATLRTGTPQQKAQLAADIIRTYGIDVEGVATALDGKPVPQGQQHAPQADPRVDQIWQFIQSNQQQTQQRLHEEAASTVEELSGKMPYLDDVRDDMATFLEVAAQRGQKMTPEQAYERACALNPDVSKHLETQKAAEAAKKSAQLLSQKRNAASSVRSSPGGAAVDDDADEGGPDDRKNDIRRAWRALSK